MTRRDFEKHLNTHGCELLREGAEHTIFFNPANSKSAPVPRHNEVKPATAKAICKALGIRAPRTR